MKQSYFSAILSVTIITLFIFTGSAFGDDAFYVDENGNVGIWASTPVYKLDVNGSIKGLLLRVRNGTWTSNGNDIFINAGSTGQIIYFRPNGDGSGLGQVTYRATGVHNFFNSEGSSQVIFNNGNVGIGTTSPGAKLEVAGYGYFNDGLRLNADSDTYYGDINYLFWIMYGASGSSNNLQLITNAQTWSAIGGGIVFSPNETEAMRITKTGNVGIGTTSPSYKLQVIGDGDFDGDLTADSYSDHTPYYEGDALLEIVKITGKDGEIDHSTLPDFAHKTAEVPTFEEIELSEISADDAFETVEVEKERVQIGTKKESKGYKAIDGEIVQVVEEVPIYEAETVQVTQLKTDVYLDEQTGKVYQKTGDGEVFEKDGKIFQRNQTGTEIEDQRDLGAMISMLTVAIQQQQKEIEELKSMLLETK